MSLYNKHKGETIVICGSGPSLKNWKHEWEDKYTIIACNDAAAKLNKFSYFFFTDASIPFFNYFKTIRDKGAKIISNAISKDHSDYFFDKEHTWKLDPNAEKMIFGYDCIHCAVHVAIIMGAAEIILTGVDLSYEGTEKYFWENPAEEKVYTIDCIWDINMPNETDRRNSFDGHLGMSLGGWDLIEQHNPGLNIKVLSPISKLKYPKITTL